MLHLPDRFMALQAGQQSGMLAALQAIDADLHQAVIDEWDVRCQVGTIKNPAGYLFGIVQKAMCGEFRAWAGGKVSSGLPISTSPSFAALSAPPLPTNPDVEKEHLSRIRQLLGRGRHS
ncbi:hypothetical protein BPMI_00632c [Candidatus Burkholderia pumila]|uniref:Replication protein P n=1 Tax=Candidatus Burkholderia pumila TaxID=1090375 RepID=A0ABR5HLA7_9BURK|nr:hypothetical protein BPMI_00632c [Candidatus Burkholderia pumila]